MLGLCLLLHVDTMECSHPVISSTPIAATPSISLLTTPTNTSAATTSTGSIKILIGAAIAAVILVAIIVSSTAIFGAAVCVKARRHCSNEELHVAKNEAYGDKVQGVTAYRESVFYDYPTTQHNKQKKNSNLHHDFTSLRSTE